MPSTKVCDIAIASLLSNAVTPHGGQLGLLFFEGRSHEGPCPNLRLSASACPERSRRAFSLDRVCLAVLQQVRRFAAPALSQSFRADDHAALLRVVAEED